MREDEHRMMRVTQRRSAAVMRSSTRFVAVNNQAQQHLLALDRMRSLLIWSVGKAPESVNAAGLEQENTATGR